VAAKKPPPPAIAEKAAARPGEEQAADEMRSLLPFLDVPVNVTVELSRKKLRVREILGLHVDSVIHMNQSAGENVDLRINGVAIGNGEIVVIEDTMGLRITDLKACPTEGE
jgi:flagellar motor switch protein FliN/FliY